MLGQLELKSMDLKKHPLQGEKRKKEITYIVMIKIEKKVK
jgi:hypothetical protein